MRKPRGEIVFHDFRENLGVETVYGKNVTHGFSRHTHRDLCIGLIEQGKRIIEIQGKRYEAAPGQIFILPPSVVHACSSANNPHTYRLLLVASGVLQPILPKGPEEYYSLVHVIIDEQARFANLLDLFELMASNEVLQSKQTALVATVGEFAQDFIKMHETPVAGNAQYDSLKQVKAYIDEHYAECFSLQELAGSVFLSPYYLIHLFKQVYSIPPHVYQQQVRIRQAKKMLLEGAALAEVALKTGFADQSYFSNVFKQRVGITPGEYVKSAFVK